MNRYVFVKVSAETSGDRQPDKYLFGIFVYTKKNN